MVPGWQEPTTHSPRRQVNLCDAIQIFIQMLSASQAEDPHQDKWNFCSTFRALESGHAYGLSMVTETRIPGLGTGLGEELKNPQ